ncbi:hypothetical protein H6P81_002739 [Aristolochia fimbriata]|uniref:Uncharacterized protein n=1 Tax=Aristolochia fimbriata TaxID=158543 RepID=A0AAV7FDT7_ARIFI|nr:hypothetical protein H6P81_002739 [Aristolochia fimbriata]
MRWYLGVTRRYIAPPPTEPAMVYHPRGYTEEALRLDKIVGRSRTAFHSWRERSSAKTKSPAGEPSHVVEPGRERAPPGNSRARRRPTARRRLRVEEYDEVPAIP